MYLPITDAIDDLITDGSPRPTSTMARHPIWRLEPHKLEHHQGFRMMLVHVNVLLLIQWPEGNRNHNLKKMYIAMAAMTNNGSYDYHESPRSH